MMIAVRTATTAAVLSLALQAGPVLAAEPSQRDFDACNQAAQAKVSAPSASPRAGGTSGPLVTSPSGTPDATSGVQAGGQGGKTGPMATGSGRSPGSAGGVREGTGAVSSGSADASAGQLRGISAAAQADPAAQQAYRDCMKQRGF
jgi:hypothetical protein